MDSFGNTASNADATSADKENCFRKVLRQRWMGSEDCFAKHRVLGRYYVAAMLFSAVTIYVWSFLSILLNLVVTNRDASEPFYPALNNSTMGRTDIFFGSLGIEICTQIPGALLIYRISSHKFLTLAVAISSIIHMLTPLATDSASLLVAIFSQKLVVAPLRIAVLSIWKDWAPPNERKKFVIFSILSWILLVPCLQILSWFHNAVNSKASFYVTGACGLVWSFLWFFTVSDTPANDSQVLKNKNICLHDNSFPIFKGKPKLSEVPWKSIIKSMPVLSLCLLYFKMGSSTLFLNLIDIAFFPPPQDFHFKLLYASLYMLILFISAILTDFMTRKYTGMIKIRKGIICGALIFHAILLFGTLHVNFIVVLVFSWLSNFVFCTSLTGIFTNALDLSSQCVSIIGGFIETSYLLGMFLSFEYLSNFDIRFTETEFEYGGLLFFSYEIGFAVIVAVVFYIWGSLEEQPWSLNSSSDLKNGNVQSFPVQEEHELRGTVPQNA